MIGKILASILRPLVVERKKEDIEIPHAPSDWRSSEYREFLASMIERDRRPSFVEKLASTLPDLGISPPSADKMEEDIRLARLKVRPTQIMSSSIIVFLAGLGAVMPLYLLLGIPLWFLLAFPSIASYYIYSYPSFASSVLKTKSQDESIKIILLLSVYLRYSPNMESALSFVARYSTGPLSSDIRNIVWDTISGKYPSLSEALREYSKMWIKWDPDFVRSMNMLVNSMQKIDPAEREEGIGQALENILTNTHLKMRKYSETLTPKIELLHMGGILMPIMGLMMFPLMSIFMSDKFNPWYTAFGYIVFLPIMLMWYSWRILSTRPGSYSSPDVEMHPDCPPRGHFFLDLEGERFAIPVLPIAVFVGLLIMLPGIFHFIDLGTRMHFAVPQDREKIMMNEADVFSLECLSNWFAYGSFEQFPKCRRGMNNVISTFSITIGIGIGVFLYYWLDSFQRAKIADNIMSLEQEFKSGIFMVANYMSNDLPVEVAIRKAIEQYNNLGIKSTAMKDFLERIDSLMRNQRYTFEMAVREHSPVMKQYPSPLIHEIMKILRESTRRGPRIAASVVKSIVRYLDNMRDVEMKIRESLEPIRNSLRMQATLITPIISASISTLSIFLINVLKILGEQFTKMMSQMNFGLLGGSSSDMDLLGMLVGDFSKVVPFTILQIIIGIYLIEIVQIMGFLLSGIDHGFDRNLRNRLIAQNVISALIIYILVSIITMMIFGSLVPRLNL